MRFRSCNCQNQAGVSYATGPTTCMASPAVLENIKSQLSNNAILSSADARLANLAGMLAIPSVGKTGFNDGVIYPPDEAPNLALDFSGTAQPSERFSLTLPSTPVTLNCLVLLVDFADNVGKQKPSHFDQLLFDRTNSNSMTTFYRELSFGKLTVQGAVTQWIRADYPYSYYTDGQSGTGNNFPHNTPGLLEETLNKYCSTNSLAPFDVNGDGYIDGLFLIHAGPGAETVSDPVQRKNMIWSHKWTLPHPFFNNGVKAYAYFTAPEDGKLGVFSHEFGHFLGLPDLYDTSYRSVGIGNWCLMSGGSWNGGGNQPARLSAWCLEKLGWIKPKTVAADAKVSLRSLESDAAACHRIAIGDASSKEYFLIENRQKTGRDARLPGHGLAVWHIDDTQSDNSNPLAYKVALIQADGQRDLEYNRNGGDGADLFPGTANVAAVNDTNAGHPHLRKNDGTRSGVSLSAIGEANGVVTVDIKFSPTGAGV